MKTKVVVRTIAMSSLLTLAGAGVALADDGSISTTGPGSVNTISSTDTNVVFESNLNAVTVTNSNTQVGASGAATVAGNTVGGSATSGNVANTNSAATTVSINNPGCLSCGGSGSGSGTGPSGGNGSGSGAGSGGVGGGSGAAAPLGVGGAGAGVLPSVGCSVVCDVSALRSLYSPANATNVSSAIDQAKGISAGLLALAAVLSLVGAGGSAAYAARRAKAQG